MKAAGKERTETLFSPSTPLHADDVSLRTCSMYTSVKCSPHQLGFISCRSIETTGTDLLIKRFLSMSVGDLDGTHSPMQSPKIQQ